MVYAVSSAGAVDTPYLKVSLLRYTYKQCAYAITGKHSGLFVFKEVLREECFLQRRVTLAHCDFRSFYYAKNLYIRVIYVPSFFFLDLSGIGVMHAGH